MQSFTASCNNRDVFILHGSSKIELKLRISIIA